MGGNSWPELGALLGDWAGNGGSLHLTLWVNDDSGVIYTNDCLVTKCALLTLEVQEIALSSSVGFSLSDDDGGQNLLSEFWLTLLDGCEEILTDGSLWESVKSSTDFSASNHIKVLGSSVISAVHN